MLFNTRNLFFAAVGAALMYFFDPNAGPARRNSMTRKAKSVYEDGAEKVRSVA